ncbi:MAG: hypothetical protein J0M04_12455 [Verrucomicrobia bacterium]|nr:hypothetical protein [Verrucomicrobiota bacterium]
MKRMLRKLAVACASALLAACSISGHEKWGAEPAQVVAKHPRGTDRWKRAESTLASLAEQRAAFLKTRDPALVFAVFYYHVTAGMLGKIRSGGLEHPDFWLDEVAAFHALYVRNLDPKVRESHWLPYHDLARDLRGRRFHGWQVANPADFVVPRSLTGHGVAAHIGTDLPRSLAEVAARHPGYGRDPGGGLERDFRKLSCVFHEASRRGFGDLRTTFGPERTWYLGAIPGRDSIAAGWIGVLRDRAWRSGWGEVGGIKARDNGVIHPRR